MLNQLILRVIYAVISAAIISIIGSHISSRLEGLPRTLRDGWFSGAQEKTGKQDKREYIEPTDRKAINASKRPRRGTRSRDSSSKNQRSQSRPRVEQNRCKGSSEMKGQPKFQRQCHNRSGRNFPDANDEDRVFSQRRYN
jgi:hypothetical protein